LEKSVEWKGERLGILEMRKHYANYFKGFQNIKFFRDQLVKAESLNEVHEILETILAEYQLAEVSQYNFLTT
jgi:tRNA-dihydrouridine synthase B